MAINRPPVTDQKNRNINSFSGSGKSPERNINHMGSARTINAPSVTPRTGGSKEVRHFLGGKGGKATAGRNTHVKLPQKGGPGFPGKAE